jgi:hypothetical protein
MGGREGAAAELRAIGEVVRAAVNGEQSEGDAAEDIYTSSREVGRVGMMETVDI